MLMRPQKLPDIPEKTAHIARILFLKGDRYMRLRDELGAILYVRQSTLQHALENTVCKMMHTYLLHLFYW